MARQLTDRQRKFCENLNRGMSAAEAARKAGYSEEYAARQAHQLMDKSPSVREYLGALRAESQDESIADGTERRRVLTQILQGKLEAPYVAGFNLVDGKPDHGARIKAAELLAKMDGDLAPIKLDINAKVQASAQDWVGRVLQTVASVLGDEAAETLLPHLPVLELER
jgi:phage terminase small subunit